MLRFVDGSYKPASRTSTIGAFFLTKRLTVNHITCKVLIWDTAGQEKFQKLTVTYYQNAAAAIICYDVSNPSGLKRLKQNLQELTAYQQARQQSMVLVVAACKSDLLPVPRMEEEARKLAASYDAMYMETSAKANRGVTELFNRTAAKVLEWHEAAIHGQGKPLPVTVGGSGGGGGIGRGASSPTSTKSRSTTAGFSASPRSFGDVSQTSEAVIAKKEDGDSCTENESDEVMDENLVADDAAGNNQHKNRGGPVTCEGSYLVCGVDDTGKGCVIL